MCSESSEYEDTEFEDDFDDDIETSEKTEN